MARHRQCVAPGSRVRRGSRALRTVERFRISQLTELTLALGVGAATAVWSVARHLVLAPVAAPNADRLAVICEFDRIGMMRITPYRQAIDAWRT